MLMLFSSFLKPIAEHYCKTPPKLPLQFICLPGGQIYGRYLYKYLYSAARRFWRTHTHTWGSCAPSLGPATRCSQWLSDGHPCTQPENMCPKPDRPTPQTHDTPTCNRHPVELGPVPPAPGSHQLTPSPLHRGEAETRRDGARSGRQASKAKGGLRSALSKDNTSLLCAPSPEGLGDHAVCP